MCEPYHSIIQVDMNPRRAYQSQKDRRDRHDDDDEGPSGLSQVSRSRRLEIALGPKIMEIGQKLGGMLHYSVPGKGHTGCLDMCFKKDAIMPEHIFFESLWWRRDIRIDTGGSLQIETDEERQRRIDLALQYDRKNVTGDLNMLRTWFKRSVQATRDFANSYFVNAMDMFTSKARDVVASGVRKICDSSVSSVPEAFKINVMDFIAEQTKRRENMVEAWADDKKLWVPQSTKMMGFE